MWRLGQVEDTKFGTNVSNKMLLNAAKCQGVEQKLGKVIVDQTDPFS